MRQQDYETLLAQYSDPLNVIQLLKDYRPYLEMVPSMRRVEDSLVSVPLPLAKLRREIITTDIYPRTDVVQLPCDLCVIMCDPEWKIKSGAEICIYIYRPEEDFSSLLSRWRKTQVLLSHPYEWVMPRRHQDIFSEGEGSNLYPLFIVFKDVPARILRGLEGAQLPHVIKDLVSEGMGEEMESDRQVIQTDLDEVKFFPQDQGWLES